VKQTDNIKPNQPLLLVRNVRYPSYQLWAYAGEVRNVDDVLKICILQTMQWLKNGRNADVQISLHLRVGADSEKHIRIYFYYDKEARKIVIGSMPKHLRTVSG
jgi:hypothetical protein